MDPIWQALAKVIETLFTRPENVALLVSVAANSAMAYFIFVMRREDREDRIAMTQALNAMTQAIDKMRLVLAVSLGKSDV